jgi:hypothetical protein
MRATGLLSLTISCAVLMHGTSYAAQQTTAGRSATAAGDHRQDGGHRRDVHDGDRYHPRSRASPIAAKPYLLPAWCGPTLCGPTSLAPTPCDPTPCVIAVPTRQ